MNNHSRGKIQNKGTIIGSKDSELVRNHDNKKILKR